MRGLYLCALPFAVAYSNHPVEYVAQQWLEGTQSSQRLDPPSCDTTYSEQEVLAQAATDSLVSQGWETVEGKMIFTSAHMFGNNPSSVYGILLFHEFPLFQMGELDAIMWLGCTPPALEYFSARSYVLGTVASPRLPFPLTRETPIFASLGDSLNNLRFNSTGGPSSPDNLNRTSAIIITANRGTAAIVADALVENGLTSDAINYDWMPSSLLRMSTSGPHVPFDELLIDQSYQFLFRVSLFEDADAGHRYANSSFPVRMFHKPSGGADDIPVDLAPVPEQIPRGTGTDESWLRPSLDQLSADSSSFWSGRGCRLNRTVSLYPIDIEGVLDCLPNTVVCGGDNRDAAYLSDFTASFTLAPEGVASFLVVTGVNHKNAGKATYSNIVIETAPEDKGVFNVTCNGRVAVESDRYEGTADVLSPDNGEADKLFAFAVSRDCEELRARAGSEQLGCLQIEDHMVRGPNPLRVVERAYLEPETTTGPAYEELLWAMVSEFVCDEF